MGTCCVPWLADHTLDEQNFRALIRAIVTETPLVYINGTAGEGYAGDEALFTQVARVFIDETHKAGGSPMVGVISTSLQEMHRRIRIVRDLGGTLVQISLPCWDVPRGDEILWFFDEILEPYPGLGFMHYNRPLQGQVVDAGQYKAVAEAHPNLLAAKIVSDSTRYIGSLMQSASPIQFFFTEVGFVHAVLQGECGLLISSSSVCWSKAKAYVHAGFSGDVAKLMALQAQISAFTARLMGMMPSGAHIDGAYDKLFSRMVVPDFPLRLLPPYLGSTDATFERFTSMLREEFPDWYR